MKRSLMALGIGVLAIAAAACGTGDIVGSQPTATPNPNASPTATQAPPSPVVTSTATVTVTPSATPVDHSDLKSKLASAQDKWFDNGWANYDFTFNWSCFCPPDYMKPARIRVRGGNIVSVVDPDTGEAHAMPVDEFRTIDGLFAYVWDEVNGSTEKIEVMFDEATGAPVSASFDRIVQAIDDEIAFHVSDLEKVDVNAEVQSKLDTARGQWASAGLSDYEFDFRWNCFCTPDYTGLVRVEVKNGEIVGVTKTSDGSSVPAEEWDRYETVDGLFGLIQEAIDQDAASIDVQFGDSGYPTHAFIDYHITMADEERGFEVSNFAVLSTTPHSNLPPV